MIRSVVLASIALVGCLAQPSRINTATERDAFADTSIEAQFVMRLRDHQGLSISAFSYRQLTHLIQRAVREGVEPYACVAPHGYRSWNQDGRHYADVWLLTLAEADSADSVSVWWHNEVCGDSLPSVHGHMGRCGCWPMSMPSPFDIDVLVNRPPPFGLLIYPQGDSVGIRVYWKREEYPFWDSTTSTSTTSRSPTTRSTNARR